MDDEKAGTSPPARTWQKWAFAAIPIAGLLELGAHVVQTHSVVPTADWKAAREYVAAEVQPTDLVVFAPRWTDPIGRQTFGAELATLEREGRPDESRFGRAFEVSIRGAHTPALAGWRRTGEQRFGGVTVTTLENPSPAHVLADLVSRVNPEKLHVSRVDAGQERECAFSHGPGQSGGLGFGPAVPGERFVCPGGGFAGVSVAADLDYQPRRCIFAPPLGSGSALRLRFDGVPMGTALHGHHTLYVEAERDRKGAPITVVFKVDGAEVGTAVHRDGEGWKPFEFDTSAFAGKTATVTAEITSPSTDRRLYCFEADTR